MNKPEHFQKIFRRAAVDRMRMELRSGASLADYYRSEISIDDKDCLLSTVKAEGKAPGLAVPMKDPVSADLDNAILLHSYYGNLDETQASDPRFWSYLSHVEFREYSLARWGIDGSYEDIKDDASARQKAINQLLEHWFISGNDRDLRRHAIARLWWAAHLTHAPWEQDPEFFGDLDRKDPYRFTRVLFHTQDIYQQVLERAMGRSNRVLITILEYIGEHEDFSDSREKIRTLMKELNLVYGTKKIIALDRPSLKALVASIASELDITSQPLAAS